MENVFRLWPILLITSVFFINFFSRTVLSPLMPQIENYLAIDHQLGGYLFLSMAVGYFISMGNTDKISSIIGHRKTILLSMVCNILFLILISAINSYIFLISSLFLLGLATGLYVPSAISTITSVTTQKHWGKALAIHELAPNLAFISAPLIVQATLALFSWRILIFLIAIAGCFILIIWQLNKKIFEVQKKDIIFAVKKTDIARKPIMWLWALIFSIGITGTLGVYSMLPLYLVSGLHYEQHTANNLVGLSRLISVPMAMFSGWLSDRLGDYNVMRIMMFLTGLVTILLGLLDPAFIPYVLFAQAALSVCFFPAAFSALSKVIPSDCRSAALSFTLPIAFLTGGGIVPAFLGYMGKHDKFQLCFIIIGIFIISGIVITKGMKGFQLKFDTQPKNA